MRCIRASDLLTHSKKGIDYYCVCRKKYTVLSFTSTFYYVWFFHPKRHNLTLQCSRHSVFSRVSGVAHRGIRFDTSLSLELCSHGISTVSASKEPLVRDTGLNFYSWNSFMSFVLTTCGHTFFLVSLLYRSVVMCFISLLKEQERYWWVTSLFQEIIIKIHELCFIVRYIYPIHVSVATDQPQAEHYNTLIEYCRVVTLNLQYLLTIAGCHY